jgi:RNA polymerase sigma-70 factor (ECF subfamily)
MGRYQVAPVSSGDEFAFAGESVWYEAPAAGWPVAQASFGAAMTDSTDFRSANLTGADRNGEDFTSITAAFRAEILAHCYRMLGSAEEAEDLVQETYLRAWRSFAGFEGRASVRTWLYRIATNACLTAIERRGRRPLPSGLGGPAGSSGRGADAPAELAATDIPWLEPFHGTASSGAQDPAAIAASRAGIRLAFVAALQYLNARQRAILILRDVLDWPAAEVAELLGTTTTAVNSGLRRARAQLAQVLPEQDEVTEPSGDAAARALIDRFAAAFENADLAALAEILREDVALEMPPTPAWFAGREAVLRFYAARPLAAGPGAVKMVPVDANGQQAFAVYQRQAAGAYAFHAITILTVTVTGISRIVTFLDARLAGPFGLPRELPRE